MHPRKSKTRCGSPMDILYLGSEDLWTWGCHPVKAPA